MSNVLESLVCVSLDVHLWSGRRQLSPKDLMKVAPSDLPPEDLASLGSKKICDPKDIAVFFRLKRQAERCLLEVGYRFLGGYGIPESKMTEIKDKLDKIKSEFDQKRDQFLANYYESIEDWISQYPEWEPIIGQAVLSARQVESKMAFGFHIFRVGQPDNLPDDDLTEGMYETIMNEVSKEAKDMWGRTFAGRASVGQRAVGAIRKMAEKLHGLMFVDPRIFPVADEINSVLANLPKTGPVEDTSFERLSTTVLMLRDPEAIREFAEGKLSADNDESTVDEEVCKVDVNVMSHEDDDEEDDVDTIPAPVKPEPVQPASGFFI